MSCKGWSSSSSPELSPVKTYTWTLSMLSDFQISKHTVLRCASPLTFLDVEKCFQCRRNIGLCGTCPELCSEGCEKNSTPSTFPLARLDKDRGKNDWSPDVQQTNVWVRGYRFMTNCLGLNQRPASVRTVLVPKDLILQQQKMSEKLRDRLREREGKKTKHQKRVSS